MRKALILSVAFIALLFAGGVVGAEINASERELIKASGTGNNDTVRQLIAAGVDVDAKANNGFTALMKAALGGHATTVRMLIGAGAGVIPKMNMASPH